VYFYVRQTYGVGVVGVGLQSYLIDCPWPTTVQRAASETEKY